MVIVFKRDLSDSCVLLLLLRDRRRASLHEALAHEATRHGMVMALCAAFGNECQGAEWRVWGVK